MSVVTIHPLTSLDLPDLQEFQPVGWSDIISNIQFYLSSAFCNPIKLLCDGQLAGIGTTILLGETAWLATIIVHTDHRNKGYGTKITEALLQSLDSTKCTTVFLIATALGEPVYKKVGFEVETEYAGFSGGNIDALTPDRIIVFEEKYTDDILRLDKKITGEDRSLLLREHLPLAQLHFVGDKLGGFYLPTLGEGPIVAEDSESGITLLTQKMQTVNTITLPIDNEGGIDFLLNHRYKRVRHLSRMRLGRKIAWQPDSIYSRISGVSG